MEALLGLISYIPSILAFLVVFSVLILIHELGHFMAARWSGVKVLEFGLGLPPKAKTLWKKGDTEYTLNWIPFGGFVRMLGEADPDGKLEKKKDSFSGKSVWKRMFISAAGVIMNFLLAFVLLVFLFVVGFKPLAIIPDHQFPLSTDSYIMSSVSFAEKNGMTERVLREGADPEYTVGIHSIIDGGTAAETEFFEVGMGIIAIDDIQIDEPSTFVQAIKEIAIGSEVALTYKKDGEIKIDTFIKNNELLGVTLDTNYEYRRTDKKFQASLLEAPLYAATEFGNQVSFTFDAVGRLVGNIFTQFQVPKEIGGPVQIAAAVHQATLIGWEAVLMLMIVLSVNLGVLNIMPFPALDGGRIFFMIWEIIFRGKPNQQVETTIHLIGYGLLMLLIIAVTYQDILRLFFGN